MPAHEYNFDGLVGPTHNYAGLSYGNLASMKHRLSASNPKQAALEGLEKMRFMASLGVKQAILPPQHRPDMMTLRRLGYSGTDVQILEKAAKDDPLLLAGVYSASSMWAANAATVSPSADCTDARAHFTPANLLTQFHRSIEAAQTTRVLRAIFADARHFVVHDRLPAAPHFADEGAANHTRLCAGEGDPGVEVFCFGKRAFDASPASARFPARQTLEASQAIARRHQLPSDRTIFVQQNPAAIDAGAFHNDVVSVGHRNVLLMHETAFADPSCVSQLAESFERVCGQPLYLLAIPAARVPLEMAIETYLFNSQLVTLPNDRLAMIAPIECRENAQVRCVIEQILADDNPIAEAHYVDVRQSMRNGGGPACLRLRVMLNDDEAAAMNQGGVFTQSLYEQLKTWVNTHYRERLELSDLADPKLLDESRAALTELATIIKLEGLYDFSSG